MDWTGTEVSRHFRHPKKGKRDHEKSNLNSYENGGEHPMTFEEAQQFGTYELRQYAQAAKRVKDLEIERDYVIEEMYEDITPTMTGVDYDSGDFFVWGSRTESTALDIIDTKGRYESMINIWQRKAELFEETIGGLTDREMDVISVHYQGRPNNLGLSPEYFNEVLKSAEDKLCLMLNQDRQEHVARFKAENKARIKQILQAS